MCSVYDVAPLQLLDDNHSELWYDTTKIRNRITWKRFSDIHLGFTNSLGLTPRGDKPTCDSSAVSWRHIRAAIPSVVKTLEQIFVARNSGLSLCSHSTVLGMDDKQLRYATRYYK